MDKINKLIDLLRGQTIEVQDNQVRNYYLKKFFKVNNSIFR